MRTERTFIPVFLLFFAMLSSQLHAQRFVTTAGPAVSDGTKNYVQPFQGGLSSPQFSSVDMNGDNLKDLFVFDRTDNKVLPYLASKSGGVVSYTYAPHLEHFFPAGKFFALMADANGDGLEDLFTYLDTLSICFNISNTTNKVPGYLAPHKLITENYYAPPLDKQSFSIGRFHIPGIADIDGDGDVDVVNFSESLGRYELYLNKKKERNLQGDTQAYDLVDLCWGSFREGVFSNDVFLNFCDTQSNKFYRSNRRHSGGSSIMLLDMDQDSDLDAVLGNVGYNNLLMLTNGKKNLGNPYDTIVAYDTIFPHNTTRAADYIFPAPYYVDVDLDGIRDMVVAPNGTVAGRDQNQVWYYRNNGLDNKPNFSFNKANFLQENSIDLGVNTHPAFWDYDNDGDQDLFVGYGPGGSSNPPYKLALFRNTGTKTSPAFTLASSDYAGLSAHGLKNLSPAFGDVDCDGTTDLLAGTLNGNVWFFKNTGSAGSPNFQKTDTNLLKTDYGTFTSPFLYDMDGDYQADLFLGEYAGNINYFRNQCSGGKPVFTLVTEEYGKVKSNEYISNTNPPGYWWEGKSTPLLADLDRDNLPELISGSIQGQLKRWETTGNPADSLLEMPFFTYAAWSRDTTLMGDFGLNSRPALADLNGDSYPELVVGISRGGLMYLEVDRVPLSIEKRTNDIASDFSIYPNPANQQLIIRRSTAADESLIRIYSVTGTLHESIKMEKGMEQAVVNCRNWSPGVYLASSGNRHLRILIHH